MNFHKMLNNIRILLLCTICIAGGLHRLHAQDPTLEIYQIRVAKGHGTVVIVKDKTANERPMVEDLAIMKVKVTADDSPFDKPFTVTLEKGSYDIDGALSTTYDGSDLAYTATTYTSGALGDQIKSRAAALTGWW